MSVEAIKVHPLTTNPAAAWAEISKTQIFIPTELKTPTKAVQPDKVRIVCMSDTHSEHTNIKFKIPNGDIFVHAGDFTRIGQPSEVHNFNNWLKSLPHRHKIVICGNHELSFDEGTNIFNSPGNENEVGAKKHLTDCIYLEDTEFTLYGIKFYGSPWQPKYREWAFNVPRGEESLSKWNLIPDDTDVLITHGPPLGRCDVLFSGNMVGCVELLTTIQQRVKPKYNIFGHIHEGYGVSSDGTTVYINASTCNRHYLPINPPIVFDMPLPQGYTKN